MSKKQWGHGFHIGKEEGELNGYYERMNDEQKEESDTYISFLLPQMVGVMAQNIIDDIRENKEVRAEAHFLARAIVRILASSC